MAGEAAKPTVSTKANIARIITRIYTSWNSSQGLLSPVYGTKPRTATKTAEVFWSNSGNPRKEDGRVHSLAAPSRGSTFFEPRQFKNRRRSTYGSVPPGKLIPEVGCFGSITSNTTS